MLQRIALLAACYALPLGGIALYFAMSGLNRQIAILSRERAGAKYAAQLARVHDRAIREAWPAAGSGSTATVDEELDALERRDKEFRTTSDAVDISLAEAPGEELTVAQLRTDWTELKAPGMGAQERTAALMGFLGQVRALLAHVADSSGLTLSPDRETEYLTDIVASTLPADIERLLQAREEIADNAAQPDRRAGAGRMFSRIMSEEGLRLKRAVDLSLRGDAASAEVSAQFQREYPGRAETFLQAFARFSAALSADNPQVAGAASWNELFRPSSSPHPGRWRFRSRPVRVRPAATFIFMCATPEPESRRIA